MDLRPELTPPILDEILVARLAELAANLDGASPGQCDDDLAEFNRLAGTGFPIEWFQGISGGESPENFVRRVLLAPRITKVADITREELIEVVRRAMPTGGHFDQHEAYMLIFDTNIPGKGASNFLFYPPDYDPATNTWGGGRPMGEYDPSPEQIVDWVTGEWPIECPKPLLQAFLDVLRWTLLAIRASATDEQLCFAYADHAHNIPDLLREFQPERLRYYWEVERVCFLHALERIGHKPPAPFEQPWGVIESEYLRLCQPQRP
ncbi:MAG TPA: hypothetical protein VHB77_08525 [Planctomycetaceae bacterium]|nr:hypothetical protein [Planctomycetaceae bacterium]